MKNIKNSLKTTKIPDFHKIGGGGSTPIDIFKNFDSIDMKIFFWKLQQICSSEKNFHDPQTILSP